MTNVIYTETLLLENTQTIETIVKNKNENFVS